MANDLMRSSSLDVAMIAGNFHFIPSSPPGSGKPTIPS